MKMLNVPPNTMEEYFVSAASYQAPLHDYLHAIDDCSTKTFRFQYKSEVKSRQMTRRQTLDTLAFYE
jgi:hypothetical protein